MNPDIRVTSLPRSQAGACERETLSQAPGRPSGGFGRDPRRRGLAPLELILVIPVLLLLTAVIIAAGVSASWKLRTSNSAHHVVMQTRWPRLGWNPQPENWPVSATLSEDAATDLPVLDLPEIDHPVVRGPLASAEVNGDLLNPTRGARLGRAAMQRDQPIPPRVGKLDYDVSDLILDDQWQYERMGLVHTQQRRIPVIYALQQAPAGLSQEYINAVMAIYYWNGYQVDLAPLDREADFPRLGVPGADFHPPLPRDPATQVPEYPAAKFSSTDTDEVRETNVEPLLEEMIPNVPESMTRGYLARYRMALQRKEQQLQAAQNLVPPNPGLVAQLQGQLAALQAELDPKIEQLEDYLARLLAEQ